MLIVEPTRPAQLVAGIHTPSRATVGECLARWRGLDAITRAHSYLVVEDDYPGVQRTFNGRAIANLAAQLSPSLSSQQQLNSESP